MKHIIELLSDQKKCTEIIIFQAIAVSMMVTNPTTVAHIWWTRYSKAKKDAEILDRNGLEPHDKLFGVDPKVINKAIDMYYPCGTFPVTSRNLMEKACHG